LDISSTLKSFVRYETLHKSVKISSMFETCPHVMPKDFKIASSRPYVITLNTIVAETLKLIFGTVQHTFFNRNV